MTSTESNCGKHAGMTSCGIDRISDLPDAMLEHILSLLRTKQAVQTSVISKRWRNLWAHSSRIDLRDNDFSSYEKFEQFGKLVLSFHEASRLHGVSIRCSATHFINNCCKFFGTWISLALKFQPKVCSIYLCRGDWSSVSGIFTCASIEDLCVAELDHWTCAHIIIPNTINLPHIRKLCLKNSCLSEKDLNRLFIGCPILDDLKLVNCICQFSPIFRQKLLKLALIDCHTKHGMLVFSDALPEIINLSCVRKLEITNAFMHEKGVTRLLSGCPLLEELSLKHCFGSFSTLLRQQRRSLSLQYCRMKMHSDKIWWEINTFSVKQVPSEDNAKLSILIAFSLHPINLKFIWKSLSVTEQGWNNNFDHKTFLLGAESLMLCFPDAKFDLKKEMRRIGKFNNLKRLSLKLADWCMHPHEIDPVIWFLQNSPSIEELTLYNPKREPEFTKKGNPKPIVLHHDSSYYNNLSIEISDHFKNLKQVEIKFCKNLFGVHSFKETVLRQMEALVESKVILSEYSE